MDHFVSQSNAKNAAASVGISFEPLSDTSWWLVACLAFGTDSGWVSWVGRQRQVTAALKNLSSLTTWLTSTSSTTPMSTTCTQRFLQFQSKFSYSVSKKKQNRLFRFKIYWRLGEIWDPKDRYWQKIYVVLNVSLNYSCSQIRVLVRIKWECNKMLKLLQTFITFIHS